MEAPQATVLGVIWRGDPEFVFNLWVSKRVLWCILRNSGRYDEIFEVKI